MNTAAPHTYDARHAALDYYTRLAAEINYPAPPAELLATALTAHTAPGHILIWTPNLVLMAKEYPDTSTLYIEFAAGYLTDATALADIYTTRTSTPWRISYHHRHRLHTLPLSTILKKL